MLKRVVLVLILISLCLASEGSLLLAQDNKDAMSQGAPGMPKPPRMAFSMVAGKIEKIDNSDPSNIKVDVKNENDGKMHTLVLTANTNITKVTDASELKTGESVRAMSKTTDGKEMAMGIVFGKLRAMPPFVAGGRGKGSLNQPAMDEVRPPQETKKI